jgi:hypothetical protein
MNACATNGTALWAITSFADPNLTVKSYTGGPDANARLGHVIVTVHSDGSLTSVLKILDNPDSANSTVSTFDAANVTPK